MMFTYRSLVGKSSSQIAMEQSEDSEQVVTYMKPFCLNAIMYTMLVAYRSLVGLINFTVTPFAIS